MDTNPYDEHSVPYPDREALAVVAIVVSAARSTLLKELLQSLPADNGAVFFLIQQDANRHGALSLDELAQWSSMPCALVEDHMRIDSNRLYVMPLQKGLTIRAHKLFVTDLRIGRDSNFPIDHFLYELADNFGSRTLCVMLAREGLDGTRGTDAIHLVNGFVITPTRPSEKFSNQDLESLEDLHVEYAPSIDELAKRLLDYIRFLNCQSPDSVARDQAALFAMLSEATGVDFTLYKQTSVLRRIHRQMQVKNVTSLDEYNRLLRHNEEELEELKQTLLIGATHFFRDPDAFAFVENKIIPTLIAELGATGQIRIWVAGCSTGEEVYSLAILLHEALKEDSEDLDVKIFATDADPVSIKFAGLGQYADTIAKTVCAEHLALYFTRVGDKFQVIKELRNMVVFAQHNLLRDPPFSQMDLVVCRNLLIYLKPETQRKVLSLFAFALKPRAFLFLGPSETLGEAAGLFQVIDAKWNVFRKTDSQPAASLNLFGGLHSFSARSVHQNDRIAARIKEADQILKMDSVYGRLIEEYVEPFVLVDENNEVLHVNGSTRDYMEIPSGKPSHNLFKMLPDYLATLMRTALHKVRSEQRELIYRDIVIHRHEQDQKFHLVVRPLQVSRQSLVVIFFQRVDPLRQTITDVTAESAAATEFPVIADHVAQHIQDLEQALADAKDNLQSTVEELNDANEEFQTINEELMVSNEELQSTNEELQSVNEELMAMNVESQRQIRTLTELNDDLNNLFYSTDIAILFLDARMRLRKFTPAIAKEIFVNSTDIGRSFAEIAHRLSYEQLLSDIEKVLLSETPIEREVSSQSGKRYASSVRPYRTADDLLRGVVLTLTDITRITKLTEELQVLSCAIAQSPGCILITDTDRLITYVNIKYTQQTLYQAEELIGSRLELLSDKLGNTELENIWRAIGEGRSWSGELVNKKKTGESFYEVATLLPILNQECEISHYLKISEDLTEKNKTSELLQRSELLSAVGQLAAGIAHEIRNPLTVLKGFLQLIAPELSSHHYTDIMLSEFTHIEAIINELLLLSRPQAMQFETQGVQSLLQDVIVLLEPQAHLSGVHIVTEFPDHTPLVLCVQNHLKQVFMNIMKNAMESMPRGGCVSVKVTWAAQDQVSILVTDEGEGIPEESLTQLGTPFYTTKPNGTGLGLLVSRRIIENHNGRIDIRSEVGVGTVVEVILNAVLPLA